ncbi:MAG: hydrogenase maturation nickel metallochaperone HypA [Calditrichaeota bacterium]|nr:MAG: hydrogenase maturation nickel metallochaperone HypA [Calditrichota bacterium]
MNKVYFRQQFNMHELSIAQNIIDIVQEYVPAESKNSVKTIRVKIGKMSNIMVDSLLFGFEALTKETNLDGAQLEIEQLGLTIRCEECGKETIADDFVFKCPQCGSTSIRIVTGNELMVSEIEIDD